MVKNLILSAILRSINVRVVRCKKKYTRCKENISLDFFILPDSFASRNGI